MYHWLDHCCHLGLVHVVVGFVYVSLQSLSECPYSPVPILALSPQVHDVVLICKLCHIECSVWKRIPFAGVCLSIATAIIQQYTALIGLSFVAVFFAFIWYILWWFTIIGYVLSADEFSNVVYFLLLISLYWGTNVCMNVSHTTTWYVYPIYINFHISLFAVRTYEIHIPLRNPIHSILSPLC